MTNKSYGQKSPGYQPEESCKDNCAPPNTSPAEFIDHECGMVHIACTPVCFKGKYYIAKAGATGDPGAASNKELWLGSFDYIDGMFWKAMMDCASPHPDAPDQLTYTVINNGDGTQSFVSSDPNVPDIMLNQPTPIPNTDNTCTITALTNQTSGDTTITETCNDKDGVVISTKEVFVIQAGAIDTINAISEPDADGKIYITRPDLSVECVYDCDGVQKLIDGIKPVCIPSGVQSIGTGILGEFEVIYGTTTPDEPDGGNGVEHYYVEPRCLTFGADCPAGIPITVRAHMDAGLLVTKPSRKGDPQYLGNCSQQWGMIAFLDGVEVKRTFDMYCLDDFGGRENASSSFTFDTVTTGQPMEVCLASLVQVATGSWEAGDIFGIDIAESDVGITVI